jgi:hypothetical protein
MVPQFSFCNNFTLYMPILIWYHLHDTGKKSSFIHRMSKLSQKTDNYMQGFKEHCKNTTLILLFKINMCYEFKILMTGKSFFSLQ